MAPSIAYPGFVIDAEGLHPLPDKVQAVQQAPTPRSVTELKSYLMLLTNHRKFLPNFATHLTIQATWKECEVKVVVKTRQDIS